MPLGRRGGPKSGARRCQYRVSCRGLFRTMIYAGLSEIESGKRLVSSEEVAGHPPRVRAPGGGRKKLVDKDALLLQDLDALVDPVTRGDPQQF